MKKKILAIGSHFDDIEIGCSGFLLKLKKKYDIFLLVATNSEIINPQGKLIRSKLTALEEFKKSMKILKPKGFKLLNFNTNYLIYESQLETLLRLYIEKVKPEIILTHSTNDAHIDHVTVANKTISTGRHVKNIFTYQSNFYLSQKNFSPNLFVDITKFYKKKIDLVSCYKGELKRVKNKWLDQIKLQNTLNGTKINCKYAEAFEVIRISY